MHCYPDKSAVRINGAKELAKYRLKSGTKMLFCATCGVQMFVEADLPEGTAPEAAAAMPAHGVSLVALNIRTLQGVEWDTLGATRWNGRDDPPAYVVD